MDSSKRVLIIDDNEDIQKMLSKNLKKMGYESEVASNGTEALGLLHDGSDYDLALLDIEMPGMNGLDLLKEIRSKERVESRLSVLMVTVHNDMESVQSAIKLGAQDYIVKPFEVGVLLHKVSRWINNKTEFSWKKLGYGEEKLLRNALYSNDCAWNSVKKKGSIQFHYFWELAKMIRKVDEEAGLSVVHNALKNHDSYPFVHALRTGLFIFILASSLNYHEDKVLAITAGGLVHDIGAIQVSDGILSKPEKLLSFEWEEVKDHVNYSVKILNNSSNVPPETLEVVRGHHERLDGTGYPGGFKGRHVSELSRIAAIADTCSALTSQTSYKVSVSPEEAFTTLMNLPQQYDHELVKVFMSNMYRKEMVSYLETH